MSDITQGWRDAAQGTLGLRQGSAGIEVLDLQFLLFMVGYNVPLDGVFDASTKDALARFQTARGISGSGSVDAATWGQLYIYSAIQAPLQMGAILVGLKRDDNGKKVKMLQYLLTKHGFSSSGVTGDFDGNTQSALMKWQEAYGFPVTGVASSENIAKMLDLPKKGETLTFAVDGGAVTIPASDSVTPSYEKWIAPGALILAGVALLLLSAGGDEADA